MPRSFTARYNGACENDCGAPIKVGDDVIYIDGELQHTGCSQITKDDDSAIPCPSCWLIGPCDCYE